MNELTVWGRPTAAGSVQSKNSIPDGAAGTATLSAMERRWVVAMARESKDCGRARCFMFCGGAGKLWRRRVDIPLQNSYFIRPWNLVCNGNFSSEFLTNNRSWKRFTYLKCINRPFLNCGLDKKCIAEISFCYLCGPVAETSLGWLRTVRGEVVTANFSYR